MSPLRFFLSWLEAIFLTGDAFLILMLLFVGLVIGISDAVVGGGNLFLISALSLLGLSPIRAVASMQVISLVQTTASTIAFARKQLINWREALIFAAPAFIGSFLGAELAILVSERVLSIFGGVAMIVVLLLIPQIKQRRVSLPLRVLDAATERFGLQKRTHAITRNHLRIATLFVFSFLMGMYGGFYGGGVGTLFLLGFFFIGEADIMRTAGTTKAINFFLSISAAGVFLLAGDFIAWRYALPLMLGTIVGSFVGVQWAEDWGITYIRFLLYAVVGSAIVKLLFF
jgi:hypothetical protein